MNFRHEYPGLALAAAAMVALSGCFGDGGGGGTSDTGNKMDTTQLVDTRPQVQRLLEEAGVTQKDIGELYDRLSSPHIASPTSPEIIIRSSEGEGSDDIKVTVEEEDGYFVVKRIEPMGQQNARMNTLPDKRWTIDARTDTYEDFDLEFVGFDSTTKGIILAKTFNDADTNDDTGRNGKILFYAMLDTAGEDDYLSGGAWMFVPDKPVRRKAPYVVATFARGAEDVYTNTGFAALTGEASYEGPAIGVYAYTRDVNDVENFLSHVGGFTGRADMAVNFGTSSEDGKIEGTIADLRFENGVALGLTGLSVPLDSVMINVEKGQAGFFPSRERNSAPVSNITQDGWDGKYLGKFFGGEQTTEQPSSIAGTFDATYTDSDAQLHLLGSFTAKKQPPTTP